MGLFQQSRQRYRNARTVLIVSLTILAIVLKLWLYHTIQPHDTSLHVKREQPVVDTDTSPRSVVAETSSSDDEANKSEYGISMAQMSQNEYGTDPSRRSMEPEQPQLQGEQGAQKELEEYEDERHEETDANKDGLPDQDWMSKSDLYPEFETQSGPPTWDVLKHKQVPIDGMGVMEEPVTSEPMWAQIHINNLTLQASSNFHIHAAKISCENSASISEHTAPTLQSAAIDCLSSKFCTAFIFKPSVKMVQLCQGYHPRVVFNPPGSYHIAGIRKGCENYVGMPALLDRRSFAAPRCHADPPSCPASMHRVDVPAFGPLPLPTGFVCDECPSAVCPEVRGRDLPGLTSASFYNQLKMYTRQMAAASLAPAHSLPYNPSIFTHQGGAFVIFRMSNTTRCSGKSSRGVYRMDVYSSKTWASAVGICAVNLTLAERAPDPRQRLEPLDHDDCHVIDDVELSFAGSAMTRHSLRFHGLEDPRGFSFNGTMYMTAAVGVRIQLPGPPKPHGRFSSVAFTQRVMFVAVAPSGAPIPNSAKMIRLHPPHLLGLEIHKNFLAVVSNDGKRLYMVIKTSPFMICQLNVRTGLCKVLNLPNLNPEHSEALEEARVALGAARPWARARGSAGFVATKYGYLGLNHLVRKLEFGRMYSQKWVLLSKQYPYAPVWMSAPFRLPLLGTLPVEDIQYPAGIIILDPGNDTRALVAYGVQDCLSALTVLQLPQELTRINPMRTPRELQMLRPAPTPPPTVQTRINLRWESQATSSSGFSTVTRAIAMRALRDRKVNFMLSSSASGERNQEPEKYKDVYKAIMHKNSAEAPNVLVRLMWYEYGPNMRRGVAGSLLVQYLPWEFEAIPMRWVSIMNEHVDEVWAPSEFVKTHFVRSGLNASKVTVMPHGVDADLCAPPPSPQRKSNRKRIYRDPELEKLVAAREASPATRRFMFLYHGGLLWRKGLDRLLEAYNKEFYGNRAVVLVIHGVYGQQGVQKLARRAAASSENNSMMPSVSLFTKKLSEEDVRILFDTADVYVHPSRSEGYGIGIAESMARGVPVILPEHGSPLDFVPNWTSFMFPASRVPCEHMPCSKSSTFVFSPDWHVPAKLMWSDFSPDDIAQQMRYAFNHPQEVKRRGALARAHICTHFTWDVVYKKMKSRLEYLLNLEDGWTSFQRRVGT